VREDRHLRWRQTVSGPAPAYTERVNRQWLPMEYAETGGVIACDLASIVATGTRVVDPIQLLVLRDDECLDIDTFSDWAVAEHLVRKRRITIRADGSRSLGMGHITRALALCSVLADHDIMLVCREDGEYALGAEVVRAAGVPLQTISSPAGFITSLSLIDPDIVVLDVLDTEEPFVQSIRARGSFVVAIEDLGPGSRVADLVINDLYTDAYPADNHWYGVEFALLGTQFEAVPPVLETSELVDHILVAFGGTDPQNLTVKALEALQMLEYRGHVSVVLGPGYSHQEIDLTAFALNGTVHPTVKNMAALMHGADLALTSAGRTVTELMTQGVPTLAMCQNRRELLHTHASAPFGVVNIGLGEHVATATLAHHIDALFDESLRRSMHDRMLKAISCRSNRRIANLILSAATCTEAE